MLRRSTLFIEHHYYRIAALEELPARRTGSSGAMADEWFVSINRKPHWG